MANQEGFTKDRGNIKWTAMMLPEHREKLHELGVRELDVDPPLKSGEDLAVLAEKIAWAYQDENMVTITYWKNKRKSCLTGKVKRIDSRRKAVMLEGMEGQINWIPAQHIFELD